VLIVTEDELDKADEESEDLNGERLYQCSLCPDVPLRSLRDVKLHIASKVL
jgi:hypothetical protein